MNAIFKFTYIAAHWARLRHLAHLCFVPVREWSAWAIPSLCLNCEEAVSCQLDFALCEICSEVRWNMPRCSRCGHRCHRSELTKTRCHQCKKQSLPFSHCSSLGPYRQWLRKAIVDVKYKQCALSLHYLQKLCCDWPSPDADVQLCFVPSHPKRLKQRGAKVQHLAQICETYLKRHQRQFMPLIEKINFSRAQVELNGEERRMAAQGTFRYIGPLPAPSAVWIFDDVYTTGSTIAAACTALSEAGVIDIRVFTLASPAWE